MALKAVPDASFLIDILRGDAAAVDLFEEMEAAGAIWHLAAPVPYELELGIQRTRSAAEDSQFRAMAAPMPTLAFDEVAASRAARLQADAFARGRPLSDLDALMLGLTDRHGAVVVAGDRGVAEAASAAGIPLHSLRS